MLEKEERGARTPASSNTMFPSNNTSKAIMDMKDMDFLSDSSSGDTPERNFDCQDNDKPNEANGEGMAPLERLGSRQYSDDELGLDCDDKSDEGSIEKELKNKQVEHKQNCEREKRRLPLRERKIKDNNSRQKIHKPDITPAQAALPNSNHKRRMSFLMRKDGSPFNTNSPFLPIRSKTICDNQQMDLTKTSERYLPQQKYGKNGPKSPLNGNRTKAANEFNLTRIPTKGSDMSLTLQGSVAESDSDPMFTQNHTQKTPTSRIAPAVEMEVNESEDDSDNMFTQAATQALCRNIAPVAANSVKHMDTSSTGDYHSEQQEVSGKDCIKISKDNNINLPRKEDIPILDDEMEKILSNYDAHESLVATNSGRENEIHYQPPSFQNFSSESARLALKQLKEGCSSNDSNLPLLPSPALEKGSTNSDEVERSSECCLENAGNDNQYEVDEEEELAVSIMTQAHEALSEGLESRRSFTQAIEHGE